MIIVLIDQYSIAEGSPTPEMNFWLWNGTVNYPAQTYHVILFCK